MGMPTSSPGAPRRAFCRSSESQPGFKSYTIAVGDGEVFSMSAWDTRADAEAGSEAVAAWVAENMADDITLKEVRYAEIKLSTTLGVSTAGATA